VENQLGFLIRSACNRGRLEKVSEQLESIRAELRGMERDIGTVLVMYVNLRMQPTRCSVTNGMIFRS